jgi:hypothetical protein
VVVAVTMLTVNFAIAPHHYAHHPRAYAKPGRVTPASPRSLVTPLSGDFGLPRLGVLAVAARVALFAEPATTALAEHALAAEEKLVAYGAVAVAVVFGHVGLRWRSMAHGA